MIRFYVISTIRRGVLDSPELLDAYGQEHASVQLRLDQDQERKGNSVVWWPRVAADFRIETGQKAEPERIHYRLARIDRMMELARRTA